MLVLRFVYVLALAVWLGGMAILGALVAPTTFEVLQGADPATGRALAGAAFGTIIGRFHFVAYGCGVLLFVTLVAMALLGPRPKALAVRCALVVTMLAIATYSGVKVLGDIDGIQRAAGALPSRLPADDPRRIRFDALHLLSERLMMVNLVLALGLVYWEAVE